MAFPSVTHPLSRSSALALVPATRPVPTNSWWSPLYLGSPATALPYIYKWTDTGLIISYPTKVPGDKYVLSAFHDDVILKWKGGKITPPRILSWDDLSVTCQWGSVMATLVQGSPYTSLTLGNTTLVIGSIHAILTVDKLENMYWVKFNNGMSWLLAGSNPFTPVKVGTTLEISNYTGVITIACNHGDRDILQMYATRPVTGGAVNTTIDGNNVRVTIDYHVRGDSGLFALPPHAVPRNTPASPSVYESIQGKLTLYSGSAIEYTIPAAVIQWTAKNPIHPSKKDAVLQALQQDVATLTAKDTYFGGKQLARVARLCLIAEELNQVEVMQKHRGWLEGKLSLWLEGMVDPFVYDTTWKGISTQNSLSKKENNFGFGWYNDHHFHLGYFLYAAAVVIKGNTGFWNKYKDKLSLLVADFANPTETQDFPRARHMDFWSGHSWASGLYPFGDGKNQESFSEAVHAYYAVALLAKATQQPSLVSFATALASLEIAGSKTYIQVEYPSVIYPEPFSKKRIVGVLWSNKVDYATWFGGNVEYIHGIQMLPFTPVTESLLDAAWNKEQYPLLAAATNANDEWKGFIVMSHSLFDPDAAWVEAQALKKWDNGNSKTNTLWFIATRYESVSPPVELSFITVTIPKDLQGRVKIVYS